MAVLFLTKNSKITFLYPDANQTPKEKPHRLCAIVPHVYCRAVQELLDLLIHAVISYNAFCAYRVV